MQPLLCYNVIKLSPSSDQNEKALHVEKAFGFTLNPLPRPNKP